MTVLASEKKDLEKRNKEKEDQILELRGRLMGKEKKIQVRDSKLRKQEEEMTRMEKELEEKENRLKELERAVKKTAFEGEKQIGSLKYHLRRREDICEELRRVEGRLKEDLERRNIRLEKQERVINAH